MPGNGWMGWRKGVDVHRAAGRQRLGSKGSGKSILEYRTGGGREGDEHARRAPTPVLRVTNPTSPRWLFRLSTGTCAALQDSLGSGSAFALHL